MRCTLFSSPVRVRSADSRMRLSSTRCVPVHILTTTFMVHADQSELPLLRADVHILLLFSFIRPVGKTNVFIVLLLVVRILLASVLPCFRASVLPYFNVQSMCTKWNSVLKNSSKELIMEFYCRRWFEVEIQQWHALLLRGTDACVCDTN